MTKNDTLSVLIIAGAVFAALLLSPRARQVVTNIAQGAPLSFSFGSGYEPNVWDSPGLKVPTINGVTPLPKGYDPDADKGGCCCSGGGSQSQAFQSLAPPTTPYMSPRPVSPSTFTVEPSYIPMQEPDWAAYLRENPDVREHALVALTKPHWTKGAGLREADYDKSGSVSMLEFARHHWTNFGSSENRVLPMKDQGKQSGTTRPANTNPWGPGGNVPYM